VKLRLLDLFSGIGGFSLGLERSGFFETVAFCEIEPFPRRVLAKHWPQVPIYEDVRTLTAARLAADGIGVDAVCGGFPCQDISSAGLRSGIDGGRSGLWAQYARIISELRPRFVIVENVADLLHRGFGRVLGDLAALGYDAEWHCIPASAIGAPHRRDRLWIVANPDRRRLHRDSAVARNGRSFQSQGEQRRFYRGIRSEGYVANPDGKPMVGPAIARSQRDPWPAEPNVDRVVDGIPRELVEPRLKALGNAVVPQIPELIGRAIGASMTEAA
jgi:DNA (cytosine-5)-methyltransferase 1